VNDASLQKTLLLDNIQRQAFFYGAVDQMLTTLLDKPFSAPTQTQKSQLLALLYEQF
jgi:hypothetical protein